MKFHGIDAQGTLYDQRVTSLPTWTVADLGRIVFLTSNDTIYIASSTGWVPLSSVDALIAGDGISITKVSTPAQSITIALADAFLASGRTLWIYENTAPTGWSIVSGCSDGLLAVKGGSGDYNVSGGTALQGTWTQLGHNHTIVIDAEASHTHTLSGTHTHSIPAVALSITQMPAHTHNITLYLQGTHDEMYGGYYGTGPPEAGAYTHITQSAGSGATHDHNGVTGSASSGSSGVGSSHTHTNSVSTAIPSNSWRPLANVGIIVEKD